MKFLETHPHDVLIPMEDATQGLIARHRRLFQNVVNLFIPEYETLCFANDKLKVLQRAEALNIPTPSTLAPESLEAGLSMKELMRYPLVVKPRVGSGSAGVEYVDTPQQLASALERAFQAGSLPLVQERLPPGGAGLGACFLMGPDQKVLAAFVHRRLREYPVGGGPSTLRESVAHEEVREHGVRLLRSLGYHGVAMVEFKVDLRDGRAKLMEVNPRFWGSLALAVDSGVNFPLLTVLAAMGMEPSPVTAYRIGHRCRWLLPGDILHFLGSPDRLHMEPSFFQFRAPNLTYDDFSADDPLPVVGAVLSLFPFLGRRDFEHVRSRRSERRG